ncbi:MAG: YoaK family protein [Peptoniphilaceae bacterium]|nr:YoaK family protein [Peptoniphilaceae bacterium]
MDAYSYLLRGEVFANAQTGNMLLFGVYASKGNLTMCLKYALPISFFTFGIF